MQHDKKLERIKNLAVAIWGSGAACCGQRVKHMRLSPAGAAGAPLQLCFMPSPEQLLLVMALPLLGSINSQHVTDAAARWLLSSIHFLFGADVFVSFRHLPPSEQLDAWLGQAFNRMFSLFSRAPAAAALLVVLGPPAACLETGVLSGPMSPFIGHSTDMRLQQHMDALRVWAPQWLMCFERGTAAACPANSCLLTG